MDKHIREVQMECNTGKIYICEICGKVFEGDHRRLNGHRNAAHNLAANRKSSETKKGQPGRKWTDEQKKKQSEIPHTAEWDAKISFAMSKDGLDLHRKYQPDSQKEKNRLSMKILANTEEFQAKRRAKNVGRTKENSLGRIAQSEKMKGPNNPMSNPIHLRKAISNSAKKNGSCSMNKQEERMGRLLESLFPCEWKFVGNGEVIIAGKCPDFININGQKKIIELYGDYWHKGDNPQDRIGLFSPYGYDTLVIWEKELKDIERVKFRINKFHRKVNPYSLHIKERVSESRDT